MTFLVRAIVVSACLIWANATVAEEKAKHSSPLQQFVHGAPEVATTPWLLAAGGRIYDNWWDALDRKKPKDTNPAYPASGKRSGSTTWRCVECHGWDYKGKDGVTGKSGPLAERYSGVVGIRGARKLSTQAIIDVLRKAPHNYTPDMITDEEAKRVAAFIRVGQHTAETHIDAKTGAVKGDAKRGAGFFQTLCAACHGLDGKALNWGTPQEPAYVGTEAKKLPWEVLHKIRNSHPGAAMINTRALPLKDAVDILAYAQTLPQK